MFLNDVIDELKMPGKRIFMMTGRAGQGKTNLLCDLVETFLFNHEIPCAFLSGRQLGLKQGPDLGQTICDHLFEKKVATLDDAALLLSNEAIRSNKPFILIIDGLSLSRTGVIEGARFVTVSLIRPECTWSLTTMRRFYGKPHNCMSSK